jgi:hypothetical protein
LFAVASVRPKATTEAEIVNRGENCARPPSLQIVAAGDVLEYPNNRRQT